MRTARAEQTKRKTRIQAEREAIILDAALDIFSTYGLRGSTLDQIAVAAGLSKPNLLYYFRNKEDIYDTLLNKLLVEWSTPAKTLDANGDPLTEIRRYIRMKLEMARDFPRESRLFASEILQGGERVHAGLEGMRHVMEEKVAVIRQWARDGKIAPVDPYHLIFSIWSTTQHYADFDMQVKFFMGKVAEGEGRFDDAARYLEQLFTHGLSVDKPKISSVPS